MLFLLTEVKMEVLALYPRKIPSSQIYILLIFTIYEYNMRKKCCLDMSGISIEDKGKYVPLYGGQVTSNMNR